jgi:preprotein translocase subunit SecD
MLKHRARAVFVLILAALIGYFVYTTQVPMDGQATGSRPFRLGLDLSGGTHLVYQADVSKIASGDISASMSSLRDVVERRVNTLGVSEPIVQTQQAQALSSKESAYKLIVELPGVTDVNEAVRAIGATPSLEFKVVTAKVAQDFENSTTSKSLDATTTASAYAALFQPTGLTGRMVSRASVQFNTTTNQPMVGLNFTSEGRDLFAKITKEHIGDYIGIFLDGTMISAPVVREEIPNGQAQISGSFTLDQAQKLVRDLNFGALPVPVSLISTQTIGPTLGQAAIDGGIRTGIIAFIIIGLFLIFWYRLPGVIATIALAVYTIIMLALFKLIPVTLTAAGIAGFILSIGMAVDANILIFERMKEELKSGRGVWDAMHEGFARAWLSIRDSNISSIITGVILYYFGSTSVVTGFALVFVVGVLVSMFTAITASRFFLYAVAPKKTTKLSTFLISNGLHI